ncbi:MAG TPA: secondary thiamine-phosphate synthase enzyme YjbQ [Thermoanaerobaculia bacterium]|jgi:secondary thiamine-phosphate synthase enzyme|nr:secondary thiamine-phosphate synthase enzyme YjbQ [Thermoanaerobaculia bacterium]
MSIVQGHLELQTSADTDVVDLTPDVSDFVAGTGIQEGILVIFVPGSTASITTIEYESGAIADLKRAMERLAPRDEHYEHNLRWGDGNGYSHIRAAMLGPSVTVPVQGGQLALGTWQQIVLCDFDNRPRRRRVLLRLLS